ncbi:hypothetical protein, partial [Methanothrix soehngenii]|uniref:hypothetical protein n=1 Tax=Methanothrix soehngenii TaxID=2223 RepID=UPI002FE1991B
GSEVTGTLNKATITAGYFMVATSVAEGGGIFIEPLGNQVGNTGLATNNTPDNIYSPAEVE